MTYRRPSAPSIPTATTSAQLAATGANVSWLALGGLLTPVTGVDAPTQEPLSRLPAELRDEGVAVLMTTHDLAAAATLCSRLCLLNPTVVADDEPAAPADTDIWLRTFGLDRAEQLFKALGVTG
ncbi:hypothetical protein ACFFSW_00090 [Saccharothrix longispora]|uniref:ABC-type hemin transport system ATPase subunit n=1 Tax=Saccharothrix longispora TaxID=33920 RepID=A0ABU1PV99_9PSEU|nr:hypothetical protein [Saccharothrix longispora]MDR6594381.1 ABC-type hemin transport system ATPase subunit [Saccharothrix longispora]